MQPLDEEYPKTCRDLLPALRALLANASILAEKDREDVALALNEIGDKARDLDDILGRLLHEEHTPTGIGELLIAFALTTEQIRGRSDGLTEKLYTAGDQLRAVIPTVES